MHSGASDTFTDTDSRHLYSIGPAPTVNVLLPTNREWIQSSRIGLTPSYRNKGRELPSIEGHIFPPTRYPPGANTDISRGLHYVHEDTNSSLMTMASVSSVIMVWQSALLCLQLPRTEQ
jgi:hypothetical protein